MEMMRVNMPPGYPAASTVFSTYYVKELCYMLYVLSYLTLKEVHEVGKVRSPFTAEETFLSTYRLSKLSKSATQQVAAPRSEP